MKKATITAALCLLLLLCLSPAAFADVNYPDPAPIKVGETLNHLAVSVEPGSEVTISAGALPPGVELDVEPQIDATYVYLRGTPTSAGEYHAALSVNNERTFLTSVDVRPATPYVSVCADVSCYVNEEAQISVTASVSDGGQLSYQWYASDGSSYSSAIAGANEAVYHVGTDYVGTTYYYCEVTNTNNGVTASVNSATIRVTVQELLVTGLGIQTPPAKTSYTVGDVLDVSGLSLYVNYSDGRSETVSSGYQLYPTLLDHVGVQTIEVSYGGLFAYFDVTVQEEPEVIEGIGVLTLPYRTSYIVGETLETSGLSIRCYTNHGTRDVSDGLFCSPTYLGSEGTQSITVSYGGKTCSFSVTVETEEQPSYLNVHQLPYKLSYRVGESLDTSGLELYLISNHNNATSVTYGYSVSPVRFDYPGTQTVTVSYAGFTCAFNVTVLDAEASPSPSPSPAATAAQTVPTPVVQETAAPVTASFAVPTPTPQPSRTVGGHRSFIGVIVTASVIALAVIGLYVYIMNRGGFDVLEQKLEDFLRRRRK